MASTLIPSKLLVTISEKLTSNGQELSYSNVLELSGIKPFDPRVMTIPFASEVGIINFSTANAPGTFIRNNVKYIRITNKDDANYIRIRIEETGGEVSDFKIEAGKSFILGAPLQSVNEAGSAFSAFSNVEAILAQANTADVDIEYFVASI